MVVEVGALSSARSRLMSFASAGAASARARVKLRGSALLGLLLGVATVAEGCCLSAGTEVVSATGQSNTGGATSGGGTSGQTTSSGGTGGGSASSGGSATTGDCGSLLSVVPSTLDFGSVQVNTTAHRSLMLMNCSTGLVTGITALVEGADNRLFTIDDAPPSTLAAGDSATVNISFAPLEGESVANAVFEASGGGKATVALSGESAP